MGKIKPSVPNVRAKTATDRKSTSHGQLKVSEEKNVRHSRKTCSPSGPRCTTMSREKIITTVNRVRAEIPKLLKHCGHLLCLRKAYASRSLLSKNRCAITYFAAARQGNSDRCAHVTRWPTGLVTPRTLVPGWPVRFSSFSNACGAQCTFENVTGHCWTVQLWRRGEDELRRRTQCGQRFVSAVGARTRNSNVRREKKKNFNKD